MGYLFEAKKNAYLIAAKALLFAGGQKQ